MPLAGRYHGLGFRPGGADLSGAAFPYAVDLVVEEAPSLELVVPVGTLVVVRDTLDSMAGVQVPSKPATFEIRRGDRLPSYQVDALDKDGNAIDLSTASSAVFTMRDRGTDVLKVDRQDASVGVGGDGTTQNRMTYAWGASDTDTPGEYEVEFELTYAGGLKRTFPASEKQTLLVRVHDDLDAA